MKYLLVMAGWLWVSTALGQTALSRPTAEEHSRQVAAFQQELNAEYRNPAESPLLPEAQKTFAGLPFYPANYAACVVARFVRDSSQAPFEMPTSTARRPLYRKYGELHFTWEGRPLRLTVYQSLDLLHRAGFEDYLFVPFTDRTNGHGRAATLTYARARFGTASSCSISTGPTTLTARMAASSPVLCRPPKTACP